MTVNSQLHSHSIKVYMHIMCIYCNITDIFLVPQYINVCVAVSRGHTCYTFLLRRMAETSVYCAQHCVDVWSVLLNCLLLGVSLRKSQYLCYLTITERKYSIRKAASGLTIHYTVRLLEHKLRFWHLRYLISGCFCTCISLVQKSFLDLMNSGKDYDHKDLFIFLC